MKQQILKKLFIFFTFFLFVGIVVAQENYNINYQQEELMLFDKEGDKVLQKLFIDTCITGMKKVASWENVPPQESQLRAPRFIEENPIILDETEREIDNSQAYKNFNEEDVLNNIKAIIEKESKNGIRISIGSKHVWKLTPFTPSKIITALATATSARFMYVGQEIPLINWIKDQEDNSVTIENLFHKSYLLNKGNMYLTILTIENVLSDATFEADREYTVVNKKLVDLYEKSPNKFGDWYHFFGTMLAGYVGEKAETIAQLYTVYRKISRGENAEKATMSADRVGADMGGKIKYITDVKVKGRFSVLIESIIAKNINLD